MTVGRKRGLKVFCIDLDVSKLEVMEFSGSELQMDLKHYRVRDPLKLTTPDRKIFKTESKAEMYLKKYLSVLRKLKQHCKKVPGAPCMLYKRRYIVQAILGEKLYTERDYLKPDWTPGMVFNFHDQVNFLPVRLNRITELKEGGYRYYYSLVKKK